MFNCKNILNAILREKKATDNAFYEINEYINTVLKLYTHLWINYAANYKNTQILDKSSFY